MLWSGDELYVVDTWKNLCYSKNPTPDPKVIHLTYLHTGSEKKGRTLFPMVLNTWIAKDRELYIYGARKLQRDFWKAGYNFCSGLKLYMMMSLEESEFRKHVFNHLGAACNKDTLHYYADQAVESTVLRKQVYLNLQALANAYNTTSSDKNNPSFKKVELYFEED